MTEYLTLWGPVDESVRRRDGLLSVGDPSALFGGLPSLGWWAAWVGGMFGDCMFEGCMSVEVSLVANARGSTASYCKYGEGEGTIANARGSTAVCRVCVYCVICVASAAIMLEDQQLTSM